MTSALEHAGRYLADAQMISLKIEKRYNEGQHDSAAFSSKPVLETLPRRHIVT